MFYNCISQKKEEALAEAGGGGVLGMALQDGGTVPQPVHSEERIVEGQRDDSNTGNNEGTLYLQYIEKKIFKVGQPVL